jgi:hypothetical protein
VLRHTASFPATRGASFNSSACAYHPFHLYYLLCHFTIIDLFLDSVTLETGNYVVLHLGICTLESVTFDLKKEGSTALDVYNYHEVIGRLTVQPGTKFQKVEDTLAIDFQNAQDLETSPEFQCLPK